MAPLQQDLGPEFESLALPEALKKSDVESMQLAWKRRFQSWLQRLKRYG